MASLLIGGAGFIGANLVEELRREGEHVCVVARRASLEKRRELVNLYRRLGVRISAPQSVTRERLRGAAKNCGRSLNVYYLIGVLKNSREAWLAHVDLAKEALEAVAEYASSFIYLSVAPVVAECKDLPRRNNYIVEEDRLLENCRQPRIGFLASKYWGEKTVVRKAVEIGVRAVVARPVAVYGPHAYYHAEWESLYRLAKRSLSISLDLQVVYSRDVARALAYIAEKGRRRIYYVAPPNKYTIRDLSREAARAITGRSIALPGKPLELVASIAYKLSIPSRLSLLGSFTSKRLFFYPANLVEEGFSSWETGRKESLEEFVEWLKKH